MSAAGMHGESGGGGCGSCLAFAGLHSEGRALRNPTVRNVCRVSKAELRKSGRCALIKVDNYRAQKTVKHVQE